jgi:chemotaxis protein CheX
MEVTHDYLVGQIQATTQDVLSMMMGIESSCQPGYLQSMDSASGLALGETPVGSTGGPEETVEAFVGISGPMVGTGTVSCDADTACRLASAMLMSDIKSVGTDVLDAMGEVANMIIGNLKTNLEDRVGPLWLSVPSVVYGRNFTARTVGKFEWTVVPVDLPEGKLRVRLCLSEAPKATARRTPEPAAVG